jgi:hypothetical protein
MNPQKKAWKSRRQNLCAICKSKPARSKTAKTCDQHCAGKLAWETRGSQ